MKEINVDAIECLNCGSTNSTNAKPVFNYSNEIPGGGYQVDVALIWKCADCGKTCSFVIPVRDHLYHDGFDDEDDFDHLDDLDTQDDMDIEADTNFVGMDDE